MNNHSSGGRVERPLRAVKPSVPTRRPDPVHAPASATAAAVPARPVVRPVVDKRRAILDAALRLIARTGLHNTPMSALAREAGVAAGTLYLYFPSKEAMINALYLELLADRHRATMGDGATPHEGAAAPADLLWRSWHGLACWHLDRPDASNVIQQCRASGILSDATRAAEQRMDAEGFTQFEDATARRLLRPMPRQVFYALFAGPIASLVQMRDAGELEVTDAVLRATFDGVCRSVLPPGGVPGA